MLNGSASNTLIQAVVIVRKDLRLEQRTKANLNSLLFLAALILVVVTFALGPSQSRLQSVAPGVLWVTFAFAGVLGFGRAYASEGENSTFEGMLVAGADPKAVFLGKLVGTVLTLLLVEAVIVASMMLLYNLSLWNRLPPLVLVALLGTVGLSAVGVVYGRLTMSLRAREIMLPLLTLPVVLPIILASVRATSEILSATSSDLRVYTELLLVFDAVFITAGLLLYGTLCED